MNGAPNPPAPPTTVALSFVGPINYPATKNLRNACANAVNNQVKNLTLLISSWGGSTNEGFALYHFLNALPLDITTHNIGSIDSVANLFFWRGSKGTQPPTRAFYSMISRGPHPLPQPPRAYRYESL